MRPAHSGALGHTEAGNAGPLGTLLLRPSQLRVIPERMHPEPLPGSRVLAHVPSAFGSLPTPVWTCCLSPASCFLPTARFSVTRPLFLLASGWQPQPSSESLAWVQHLLRTFPSSVPRSSAPDHRTRLCLHPMAFSDPNLHSQSIPTQGAWGCTSHSQCSGRLSQEDNKCEPSLGNLVRDLGMEPRVKVLGSIPRTAERENQNTKQQI